MRVLGDAGVGGVDAHGDPVGRARVRGGVEGGHGVAPVLQVQGADRVRQVYAAHGRAGGEQGGDVVVLVDPRVAGEPGDHDAALGVPVEAHGVVRPDAGLLHGGDDGGLHVRGHARDGLEVGEQVLGVGAAEPPVGGAGDDDDPGGRPVGVVGAQHGDDAGGVVLPAGLDPVGVADDVGGAAQRLGLLRVAGRRGADDRRPAQSEGVGRARRDAHGRTAPRGDGQTGLGPVAVGGVVGRAHGEVGGDPFHGTEGGCGDEPRADLDLVGELRGDGRVQALGGLGEVGLDNGRLGAGPGPPGHDDQDHEEEKVIPDPVPQVARVQDDVEGVEGVGDAVGQDRAAQRQEVDEHDEPEQGLVRDPVLGHAREVVVPQRHGARQAGVGGRVGLGAPVDLRAARDVVGEVVQGLGDVGEGPGPVDEGVQVRERDVLGDVELEGAGGGGRPP